MHQQYTIDELVEQLRDFDCETNAANEAKQVIERVRTEEANYSSPNYRFPLSQTRSAIELKGLKQLSVDELLQRLEELSSGQMASISTISYSGTARTLFCAINLELNERRLIAPQFRSMRRSKGKSVGSRDESTQSNDRQVIDLHWLHSEGKRDGLDHEEFANLFVDDQFDFDLASALASKEWSAEHKSLNILKLIDFEMHQLSWFRSASVRSQWRNGVTRMNGSIERHLRSQTVREQSFKQHVEGIKKVWLAMYLAEGHGSMAASRLFGWMTGLHLAKSTWSDKVKRMKTRTGWNGDA